MLPGESPLSQKVSRCKKKLTELSRCGHAGFGSGWYSISFEKGFLPLNKPKECNKDNLLDDISRPKGFHEDIKLLLSILLDQRPLYVFFPNGFLRIAESFD